MVTGGIGTSAGKQQRALQGHSIICQFTSSQIQQPLQGELLSEWFLQNLLVQQFINHQRSISISILKYLNF